MSVTLRNANFLYVTCAGSTAHAHGRTIVVDVRAIVHKYLSTTDQSARWITDPTKDEGDRI